MDDTVKIFAQFGKERSESLVDACQAAFDFLDDLHLTGEKLDEAREILKQLDNAINDD